MAKIIQVTRTQMQVVRVDTLNEVPNIQQAKSVLYDSSTSGLDAVDVQAALDELAAEKLDFTSGGNKKALEGTEESFTKELKDKLDEFKQAEDYVLNETEIITSTGLSGGRNLRGDVTLSTDLASLPLGESGVVLDPVKDYVISTNPVTGIQQQVRLVDLPSVGAFRIVGAVAMLTDDQNYLKVISKGNVNEIITECTAPIPEFTHYPAVSGYVFIVNLTNAQKSTGLRSTITGKPTILFDQDQLLWTRSVEGQKSKWHQLEVGDAVISIHGRIGFVTSEFGDYNADQVVTVDSLGVLDGETVQYQLNRKASTLNDEYITGLWNFSQNPTMSGNRIPTTTISRLPPRNPETGDIWIELDLITTRAGGGTVESSAKDTSEIVNS